jgi:hypothetical protein
MSPMRLGPTITRILVFVSLLPLTGCVLFHSNVKGGFACSAPSGTCAPSSAIDDSAIRAMGADAASVASPTDRSRLDGASLETASIPAPPSKEKPWAHVSPARPALKIVYLPWRDAAGRLHPRTSSFVSVEAAPAPTSETRPIDQSDLGAAPTLSLLAIAEMAPELGEPIHQAMPATATATNITRAANAEPAGLPTSSAKDPIAAIKDQVKQILESPKPARPQHLPVTKAPAAPPKIGETPVLPVAPAKPDNAPASFPPEGN